MVVTLPSLGIVLLTHPKINVLDAISMMQFPAERYTVLFPATVTLVSPLQSENASEPIRVTLPGIVMLVNPRQAPNAYVPILVTPFGTVILVNPLHFLKA